MKKIVRESVDRIESILSENFRKFVTSLEMVSEMADPSKTALDNPGSEFGYEGDKADYTGVWDKVTGGEGPESGYSDGGEGKKTTGDADSTEGAGKESNTDYNGNYESIKEEMTAKQLKYFGKKDKSDDNSDEDSSSDEDSGSDSDSDSEEEKVVEKAKKKVKENFEDRLNRAIDRRDKEDGTERWNRGTGPDPDQDEEDEYEDQVDDEEDARREDYQDGLRDDEPFKPFKPFKKPFNPFKPSKPSSGMSGMSGMSDMSDMSEGKSYSNNSLFQKMKKNKEEKEDDGKKYKKVQKRGRDDKKMDYDKVKENLQSGGDKLGAGVFKTGTGKNIGDEDVGGYDKLKKSGKKSGFKGDEKKPSDKDEDNTGTVTEGYFETQKADRSSLKQSVKLTKFSKDGIDSGSKEGFDDDETGSKDVYDSKYKNHEGKSEEGKTSKGSLKSDANMGFKEKGKPKGALSDKKTKFPSKKPDVQGKPGSVNDERTGATKSFGQEFYNK